MILDPFLGSGTTATVAKKLGRKYYGIEKEKTYFKAAEERLKNTKPLEDNFLDTLKNNRSKPRIPFGSLVELGIIKPGTSIFDQKKKIVAIRGLNDFIVVDTEDALLVCPKSEEQWIKQLVTEMKTRKTR